MAKRRNSRHSTAGRAVQITPQRYRPPTLRAVPPPTSFRLSPLPPNLIASLEDRRRFFPDALPTRDMRPPLAVPRSAARVVVGASQPRRQPGAYSSRFKPILKFALPQRVAMCAKREIRKQVLHAFGKTGRNGQRKSRRNFWSAISCRR